MVEVDGLVMLLCAGMEGGALGAVAFHVEGLVEADYA